jgi:CTP-dependent riboflavin kinase
MVATVWGMDLRKEEHIRRCQMKTGAFITVRDDYRSLDEDCEKEMEGSSHFGGRIHRT